MRLGQQTPAQSVFVLDLQSLIHRSNEPRLKSCEGSRQLKSAPVLGTVCDDRGATS